MKCRNVEDGQECGADLPSNAKFCGECGADVVIRTGNCPKCKETIKETQKFCFGCKWKVNESIFQSQASTSEKEENVPKGQSTLEKDKPVIDEGIYYIMVNFEHNSHPSNHLYALFTYIVYT